MPRFKQFRGTGPALEEAVNRWLEAFEPDVSLLAQSVEPSGDVTLSFIFDESFRGQERRLADEHGMSVDDGRSAALADEPLQVRSAPGERGPEPDTSAS